MSVCVTLAAFPHRVTEELMCIELMQDDDIDSDADHCYYHVLYCKSSGEIGMVTRFSRSFCACHMLNMCFGITFSMQGWDIYMQEALAIMLTIVIDTLQANVAYVLSINISDQCQQLAYAINRFLKVLMTNGFPRSVKCKLYVYQPVGTLSYSFLTVTYKLFCIFRMFKCRNLQNDRQLTGSAKPVSHVLMNPTQLPTQDLPNSPSDWLASLVAFSTQTVKSHSSSAFGVF